jgi:hypothetical protein
MKKKVMIPCAQYECKCSAKYLFCDGLKPEILGYCFKHKNEQLRLNIRAWNWSKKFRIITLEKYSVFNYATGEILK